MRRALGLTVAGLGAVMLTGAAVAASRESHTLNIPLPDGSIAHVEYIGSIAPKVTVSAAPVRAPFEPFAMLDRSAFEMQRQMHMMMRQIDSMAHSPVAGSPGLNVASFGNQPAGLSSVTIVTTSNGSKTCTRRTEVESQGPAKPPKVVSSLSGDCGSAAPAPERSANPT